jgi:hypothetical protein
MPVEPKHVNDDNREEVINQLLRSYEVADTITRIWICRMLGILPAEYEPTLRAMEIDNLNKFYNTMKSYGHLIGEPIQVACKNISPLKLFGEAIGTILEMVKEGIDPSVIALQMTASSAGGYKYTKDSIQTLLNMLADIQTNGYLIRPRAAAALIHDQQDYVNNAE